MSDLKFKAAISKNDFEIKLGQEVGSVDITATAHNEWNGNELGYVPMELYYKNDVHVGTYCNGKGWIF